MLFLCIYPAFFTILLDTVVFFGNTSYMKMSWAEFAHTQQATSNKQQATSNKQQNFQTFLIVSST
jgi:hypothetical protein